MIRILSVAIPTRILTLVLTETAILFGCYFFTAWVDPDIAEIGTFVQFDAGLQRAAIVVGTILLGLYFRDLYAQVRIRSRLEMIQELITVFAVAFIAQGLIHYVANDYTLPRKMMLIGSPLALAALIAWRLLFDAAARDEKVAQRLLFLGISPAALELAAHLQGHPELGILPLGYLSDQKPGPDAESTLPWLGGFALLDAVIENQEPGSLVIARREEILPVWSHNFLELDFGGIRIEEVSALYERTFGRIHASDAWPPRFIVADIFEPDPAISRLQDIYSPVLAAGLLLFLAPVLLAVAAWVRFSSGGPILVRPWRAGLDGVPFRLWRFRIAGVSGGQWLRRRGLDALPQLLNVLAGQMLLVGPAAERPEYAATLSGLIPFYSQRTRVKPGITGWEQVHRFESGAPDTLRRLEYDLYYIKNLAPSLDSAVVMLALKERFL